MNNLESLRTIKSNKGKFIVGDPFKYLDHHKILNWENDYNKESGNIFDNNEDNIFVFICQTEIGAGLFEGSNDYAFETDSGYLAVIPLEFIDKSSNIITNDTFVINCDNIKVNFEVGNLNIIFENNKELNEISISTNSVYGDN